MSLPDNHLTLPVRVYHEDVDDMGVVYYANYLKFMSRARSEWLRSMDFDQVMFMREQRITFAIRKVSLDFLHPARLDDELIVGAALQRFGPASLNFDQKVSLASGELLCRGYVKLACIDIDTLHPCKIPADLIVKLT
uniref:Acyl-CoA thioester hydrolase n=1 Tax=Candidatus Kentrum sp. FM TaxID=2126340 RepID=A0A450SNN1_9GAMM|nr:MAG: acyl-CoA thioester hydrolase [Candidatus Kentron sp. FM]VFJ55462.1 MAG: acyl-CoA thioester hydrolase [Candidatus Kentron sp. FM]VFK11066.1 MAG: acyl-CoA thioester hydrolase [Candidatus Kentron sp. FM]